MRRTKRAIQLLLQPNLNSCRRVERASWTPRESDPGSLSMAVSTANGALNAQKSKGMAFLFYQYQLTIIHSLFLVFPVFVTSRAPNNSMITPNFNDRVDAKLPNNLTCKGSWTWGCSEMNKLSLLFLSYERHITHSQYFAYLITYTARRILVGGDPKSGLRWSPCSLLY